MTYACSGCGRHTCGGECFDECEADYLCDECGADLEKPTLTGRCQQCAEAIVTLEPRKRPDGRWEIAA